MTRICPYCSLTSHQEQKSDSFIIKKGSFYRKSDRKQVQRYKCTLCLNNFCSSTLGFSYNQKKRQINGSVFSLLSAGVSLRESARVLKINKKTVSRKLSILGRISYRKMRAINNLKFQNKKIESLQFDDMETFEHTKMKPISIALAVEENTRLILDFKACKQPAKGLLAQKSRDKYGKREDERPQYRKKLFKALKGLVIEKVQIKSDESTHYIKDIKTYFPLSMHIRFKGRRGCVVGQGELKAGGFDPLFSLNHTAAMARYKMSRLIRKTWSTTKKIEGLRHHFSIMALQHNLRILKKLKQI